MSDVPVRIRRRIHDVQLNDRQRPDGWEARGFEMNQAFLIGIAVYVAISRVMIFLSLALRPRCRSLGEHRCRGGLRTYYRGFGHWRRVDLCHVAQRSGGCTCSADRVVCMYGGGPNRLWVLVSATVAGRRADRVSRRWVARCSSSTERSSRGWRRWTRST